jgi:hypothetical protein
MFKFELDQTVYFLMHNRVCSAPVVSRMLAENLHAKWNATDKQREMFQRFGPCRVVYATVHGEYDEAMLFASREELAVAILEERI